MHTRVLKAVIHFLCIRVRAFTTYSYSFPMYNSTLLVRIVRFLRPFMHFLCISMPSPKSAFSTYCMHFLCIRVCAFSTYCYSFPMYNSTLLVRIVRFLRPFMHFLCISMPLPKKCVLYVLYAFSMHTRVLKAVIHFLCMAVRFWQKVVR